MPFCDTYKLYGIQISVPIKFYERTVVLVHFEILCGAFPWSQVAAGELAQPANLKYLLPSPSQKDVASLWPGYWKGTASSGHSLPASEHRACLWLFRPPLLGRPEDHRERAVEDHRTRRGRQCVFSSFMLQRVHHFRQKVEFTHMK